MIVFSGLNGSACDDKDPRTFARAVPIVNNRRTAVHFIRIDTGDRNRFGFVIKVLATSELPSPFDINPILNSFERSAKDESKYTECTCSLAQPQKQTYTQKI